MTYTALKSHVYDNVLVIKYFIRPSIFHVPTYARTSIYRNLILKVGLSPSKKICVICFTESPLKIMKKAFFFSRYLSSYLS